MKIKSLEAAKITKIKWLVLGCMLNAEMLCTRHAGHAEQPEAALLNLLVRDASFAGRRECHSEIQFLQCDNNSILHQVNNIYQHIDNTRAVRGVTGFSMPLLVSLLVKLLMRKVGAD